MEQTRAKSCANYASIVPAGKVYQRCSGCQQASYCSRDCQKEHWRQHKHYCREQQHARETSANTKTTGDHDDEDEADDCIAYEELRPLSFLSDPFPGLNLSIDGFQWL
jgi:hypothetical protein